MSQIVLEKVCKHFGKTVALQDVSIDFSDGITTALVGRSGSGKSTLLRLINGLVPSTSGTISVFDRPIADHHLPKLRRRIGYAVQGTGLFPHLTAGENIALLAKLSGWEPARVALRAEELLRLVGLEEEHRHRYPHQLSGGQQQRVGLCRALVLDPSLILLDEPFGALDPLTRHDIQTEFLHLQKLKPRTALLVTHDLREALRLSQWLVVLHYGRVVQAGRPEEVVRQPANAFVEEFCRLQLEP